MTKTITVSLSDELYEVWKTLPHGKRSEWFSDKLDEISKLQKLFKEDKLAVALYIKDPLRGHIMDARDFIETYEDDDLTIDGFNRKIVKSSIKEKLSNAEETSENRLDRLEDTLIGMSERLESIEKLLNKSKNAESLPVEKNGEKKIRLILKEKGGSD